MRSFSEEKREKYLESKCVIVQSGKRIPRYWLSVTITRLMSFVRNDSQTLSSNSVFLSFKRFSLKLMEFFLWKRHFFRFHYKFFHHSTFSQTHRTMMWLHLRQCHQRSYARTRKVFLSWWQWGWFFQSETWLMSIRALTSMRVCWTDDDHPGWNEKKDETWWSRRQWSDVFHFSSIDRSIDIAKEYLSMKSLSRPNSNDFISLFWWFYKRIRSTFVSLQTKSFISFSHSIFTMNSMIYLSFVLIALISNSFTLPIFDSTTSTPFSVHLVDGHLPRSFTNEFEMFTSTSFVSETLNKLERNISFLSDELDAIAQGTIVGHGRNDEKGK